MPRFTTAPVQEVMPQRKQRQPSQRAQMQQQYRDALQDAIVNKHEALVVELERLVVVPPAEVHDESLASIGLERLMEDEDVADGLRHLRAVEANHSVVHP